MIALVSYSSGRLNLYAQEDSMRKISLFALAAAFVLAGIGVWVASTTQASVPIAGIDACAWQKRGESQLGCPSMIETDFANLISPFKSPVIGSIV
jgi:hypothetical protein